MAAIPFGAMGFLMFVLSCGDAPAKKAPIRLIRMEDIVPGFLVMGHLNLEFSQDGCHLLIERREGRQQTKAMLFPEGVRILRDNIYTVKAIVSTGPDGGSVMITQEPEADGTWRAGGEIIAETTKREIATIQPTPELTSATHRRVLTPERQEFVFLDPGPKEREALRRITSPDGTRFEDAAGVPVFPGQELWSYTFPGGGWPGREGLFGIRDEKRMEITLPDPFDAVTEFSYDTIKRRVLASGGPQGTILFELDTGKRRVLQEREGQESCYYLIPGHDVLLLHRNTLDENGDNYTGASTHVCDLDGSILQDVPDGPGLAFDIVCSQHMIAFPASNGKRTVFRVYLVVPNPL